MSQLPIRTLLFGAAALALAGGTLFFGQDLVSARGAAPAVPVAPPAAPASRSVLVATRLLAVGTSVKAGDLAWRDWPASGIDPAYILGSGAPALTAYDGSIARAAIHPGEPITATRLAAPGARGALAAVTSRGQRAVSIGVTPTSGVSGLIVPGDRVDVVLTYALPRAADASAGGGIERRAATTILTDLKVLAVDQQLSGAPADGKQFQNVSLEVTAKQSEALALAADLGKLSLSLRSSEKETYVSDATASTSTVDYQVGRLLPGLGRRAVGRPRRAGVRRAAAPVTEFHGSKLNPAEPAR